MNYSQEPHIKEFVEKLQTQFGDRLLSVCVYGPAAQGELLSKPKEEVNVLVVVKNLTTGDLEKTAPTAQHWNKHAHALPMFLSEEEWGHSADIYALEYADIQDNHQVVYGEDIFSSVEIHREALRLVCELEVHRKLLFLRQRLLLFQNQPKALAEFLYGTIYFMATIGRGVLRLSLERDAVPVPPYQVFEALPKVIPTMEKAPFLRTWHAHTGQEKLPQSEVVSIFHQYVTAIGQLYVHLNEGVSL